MTSLLLDGWGMQPESLLSVFPEGTVIDYLSMPDRTSLFSALKDIASVDVLVGWSLGGLLVAEAVLEGVVKPKRLVLIAAPFRFVADTQYPEAMPPETYEAFCTSFQQDRQATLRRMIALCAKGDWQAATIRKQLQAYVGNPEHLAYWLDYLGKSNLHGLTVTMKRRQETASAVSVALATAEVRQEPSRSQQIKYQETASAVSVAPATAQLWAGGQSGANKKTVDKIPACAGMTQVFLIHGQKDAVVPVGQVEYWKTVFPDAISLIIEGCGHVPHLHDTERLKQELSGYVR